MNLKEYKRQWKKPLRKVMLCYLVDGNKVLLAMKKRGFGKGKWNGVGGKLKDGESVEDAARRETKEEIGIEIKEMQPAGLIRFYFLDMANADGFNQECYVFRVTEWRGSPAEGEEMLPKWFEKDRVPFESMWSDDIHWLPKVLAGKFVDADFLFDEQENAVDIKIEERV